MKKKGEEASCREQESRYKGEMEGAKARHEQVEKAMGSKDLYETYLSDRISEARSNLKDAREKLECYTWRCWGPFVEMWKRDVELQQQKVKQYEDDLKAAEQTEREFKGQGNHTLMEQAQQQARKLKAKSEGRYQQAKDELKKCREELDEKLRKKEAMQQDLEQMVREDGMQTYHHLQEAYSSLLVFGEGAQNTVINTDELQNSVQRQVGSFLDKIMPLLLAQTSETQERLVTKWMEEAARGDVFGSRLFAMVNKSTKILQPIPEQLHLPLDRRV